MGNLDGLKGCGTALITPFLLSGSVDEKALASLVNWQIQEGIHFLVPCGTTGESPTLKHDEHLAVVDITVKTAKGRVPVIAGAGGNDTSKVITLIAELKKLGVDGILSVSPYYNKPTQEGIYQHFRALAESTDMPIIVYNVPGRTSGNIEAATLLRMAEEIPNVVMVKEASCNLSQVMEIARNKPKNFSLLSGDDALAYSIIALGGDGCISVVSNEMPKEYSDLMRLCLNGEWTEALQLQYRLLPLMNINFIESSPIPVKTALAMMGMIEEAFRLPMVPITEPSRAKLKKVLEDLKLV